MALRWLSPRVARFSELNPDVSIVLQHSVNSEDFKLQDVDIAIRWSTCDGRKDRSRLLEIPMPLYPVCSPKLLQRFALKNPAIKLNSEQISQPPFHTIPLLCEDRRLDLWQAWYGEQPHPLQNPRRIIADANVRTQAAIDGQGWTMADTLMRGELASGGLLAPFEHQLEGYGYILMASPGRYLNRKAREFRDWLLEAE